MFHFCQHLDLFKSVYFVIAYFQNRKIVFECEEFFQFATIDIVIWKFKLNDLQFVWEIIEVSQASVVHAQIFKVYELIQIIFVVCCNFFDLSIIEDKIWELSWDNWLIVVTSHKLNALFQT